MVVELSPGGTAMQSDADGSSVQFAQSEPNVSLAMLREDQASILKQLGSLKGMADARSVRTRTMLEQELGNLVAQISR